MRPTLMAQHSFSPITHNGCSASTPVKCDVGADKSEEDGMIFSGQSDKQCKWKGDNSVIICKLWNDQSFLNRQKTWYELCEACKFYPHI